MSAESIPYEKQFDPHNTRTCGAACLVMAYKSLGKEVAQTEIWPAIAKQNRFGSVASTTHLMAQDAIKRGFSAVAIQVRHPLQVLRLCRDAGIIAILNHRSQKDSPTGHYSVLVNIDDKHVTLHDPFYGPSRQLLHAELLELWQPNSPNSEIAGHMLIAIAAGGAPDPPACEFCHTAMPGKIECPRCKQAVGLRPSVPLGCIKSACIARMWNYLCCPSCDFTWTFSTEQGSTAGATSAPKEAPAAAAGEPSAMEKAFAELDKFCAMVLAMPKGAENPDIRKQIDFLNASKEKITLARAEAVANLTAHTERMSAMTSSAKAAEENHRKKVDAMNVPPPVLDGDALGAALLKNLGFK